MEKYKDKLTPEQYKICWESKTESPFSGKYNDHFENGDYHCVCCDQKLFEGKSKFPSQCGWPSFDEISGKSVSEKEDTTHHMVRTEVVCAGCGAHLGHVFPDGPTKTGLRYCINSASLVFKESLE